MLGRLMESLNSGLMARVSSVSAELSFETQVQEGSEGKLLLCT